MSARVHVDIGAALADPLAFARASGVNLDSPPTEPPPSPTEARELDITVTRKLSPTGDRVLVRRLPHVRRVQSLLLVGGKTTDIVASRIVALGPDVKSRPWELGVGMYVLHARACGIRYDGVLGRLDWEANLVFLHEHELIATINPECVETFEGRRVEGKDGWTDLSNDLGPRNSQPGGQ